MVASSGTEIGGPELANAGQTDDFRVRSAARKRERMRARLLDATMAACAERGAQSIIIEDVLRTAEVSRGTFYAHFESLHEAISLLGQRLADEAVEVFLAMYNDIDDPVLRTAGGPQLVLSRAALEPAWGRIIAQSEEFSSHSTFVESIRDNIMRARRHGDFRRSDIHAAVDLHIGAMLCGARRLQEKKRGRMTYIRDVATNLLLALGLPEARAIEAVEWAAQDIRKRAPSFLPWWKELK